MLSTILSAADAQVLQIAAIVEFLKTLNACQEFFSFESQYSTVVLTVVMVMIAKYRKSGIWVYRSTLTPEPIELK